MDPQGFLEGYCKQAEGAPNYVAAEKGSGKSCASCAFLNSDTGECIPYAFKVNPEHICDIYAPSSGESVLAETFK
jgi:hypothetical protein